MPQVNVLYFAQIRDRLGRERDNLLLAAEVNSSDIIAAVSKQHPQHTTLIERCRVAVDHVFISSAVSIDEKSEIALIPPVSGG